MITNLTQYELVEAKENPMEQGNRIKLKEESFKNSKKHISNIAFKAIEKASAMVGQAQHTVTKKITDIKSEITFLVNHKKENVLDGFRPINVKPTMRNNIDSRYQKFLVETLSMEKEEQPEVSPSLIVGETTPTVSINSDYAIPSNAETSSNYSLIKDLSQTQESQVEPNIPTEEYHSNAPVSSESSVSSSSDFDRKIDFSEHDSNMTHIRGELQQMQEQVKEAKKMEEESERKLAEAEVRNNEMQKKIADAKATYQDLQERYYAEVEKQKNLMGNIRDDLANQIQQSKTIAENNDYKVNQMNEQLSSNTEYYNNLVQKTAELEEQMKALQRNHNAPTNESSFSNYGSSSNVVDFSSYDDHQGYGRAA